MAAVATCVGRYVVIGLGNCTSRIVLDMALSALPRSALKNPANVTRFAPHRSVCTTQLETGAVVFKLSI